MENSSFIKQAKSDIFKELHPIITFYVNKGAKPNALKKFYKNTKRFNDILDDIKNKGVNLIKDEVEYKKIVKEVLYDILDDFIAKEKDEEYKNKKEKNMKHIKEFNQYNEAFHDVVMYFCIGFFVYKFLKGLLYSKLRSKLDRMKDNEYRSVVTTFLEELKHIGKIQVSEFADRFFMRIQAQGHEYDLRLLKEEKKLLIQSDGVKDLEIPLSDQEFEEFLKLIKKA